jgi:hypothetical protein
VVDERRGGAEAGARAVAWAAAGTGALGGLQRVITAEDVGVADLARVLGELHTMSARLPQLLEQLAAALDRQRQTPGSDVVAGKMSANARTSDLSAALVRPCDVLEMAAGTAAWLTDLLSDAQQAITGSPIPSRPQRE